MKCIERYTEQGIEVEIYTSSMQPTGYDPYIYFVGRATMYAPTTHTSLHAAHVYAYEFITRFMQDGGPRAYLERVRAFYANYTER